MTYASPQIHSASGSSERVAEPHTAPTVDYLQEISKLHNQIRVMQLRQELLQRQLEAQDRMTDSVQERLPIMRDRPPEYYSPVVNLAFRVLKWLFLFIAGFTIACTISVSLKAPDVAHTLLQLMTVSLTPLIAFTLCVIAGAVILESVK